MRDAVSQQAPVAARALLGRLALHLRLRGVQDRLVGQLLLQSARDLYDRLIAHGEALEPGEASHMRRVAISSVGELRQGLHAAWACNLLDFFDVQAYEVACRRLQDALGLLRHGGEVDAPPSPDVPAHEPVQAG